MILIIGFSILLFPNCFLSTLADSEVKQLVNSLISPLLPLSTVVKLNSSQMPLQPRWISGLALVFQWPVWIAGSLVLFPSSCWSLSICILYNFNSVWCCHSCFHLYFYSNWIKILGARRDIQVNSSHTRSLNPAHSAGPQKELYVSPQFPGCKFCSCLWPDLDLPH